MALRRPVRLILDNERGIPHQAALSVNGSMIGRREIPLKLLFAGPARPDRSNGLFLRGPEYDPSNWNRGAGSQQSKWLASRMPPRSTDQAKTFPWQRAPARQGPVNLMYGAI